MHALRIGASLTLAGLAVLPGPCAVAQEPATEQPAAAALQPAIGEEEMRAIVRESLGVEILRVEVVEHRGAPAYAITVMTPGGDRNDAFRVATLLFDGATGGLLGPESAAPTRSFEGGGEEIRRRTWR